MSLYIHKFPNNAQVLVQNNMAVNVLILPGMMRQEVGIEGQEAFTHLASCLGTRSNEPKSKVVASLYGSMTKHDPGKADWYTLIPRPK